MTDTIARPTRQIGPPPPSQDLMTTTELPTVTPSSLPPTPHRRSRVKVAIIALLILAVLVVASAIGFVLYTSSKIDRIPAADVAALTPVANDSPRNILVVGVDSRADLPDDFENFGNPGSFAGSRTDVIMLMHFVPGQGAQLLSIPRDLKVQIPGSGTGKINAATTVGGPDALIQVIQNEFAIDVNNYMEIDFAGFADVVDSLGGVTLTFENAARDTKSGFAVEAGTHELDGKQALAYVRSRNYQELIGSSWKSTKGTDIGRTRRQQEVLIALLGEATSASNAFDLPGFVSTLAGDIRADSGLDTGVLVSLGRSALDMRSGDIDAITLPVDITTIDGVSYVVPNAGTQPVVNAFIAKTPFPR
jgi:LCP family protein required for cell wall assembly